MKKIMLIIACIVFSVTGVFSQATNSKTPATKDAKVAAPANSTKNTKASAPSNATKNANTSGQTAAAKKKPKPKPPIQLPVQYYCPKCHEASQMARICPHCNLQIIKEGTYYCKTCYASSAVPGKCVKCDRDMELIDGRR